MIAAAHHAHAAPLWMLPIWLLAIAAGVGAWTRALCWIADHTDGPGAADNDEREETNQ